MVCEYFLSFHRLSLHSVSKISWHNLLFCTTKCDRNFWRLIYNCHFPFSPYCQKILIASLLKLTPEKHNWCFKKYKHFHRGHGYQCKFSFFPPFLPFFLSSFFSFFLTPYFLLFFFPSLCTFFFSLPTNWPILWQTQFQGK